MLGRQINVSSTFAIIVLTTTKNDNNFEWNAHNAHKHIIRNHVQCALGMGMLSIYARWTLDRRKHIKIRVCNNETTTKQNVIDLTDYEML